MYFSISPTFVLWSDLVALTHDDSLQRHKSSGSVNNRGWSCLSLQPPPFEGDWALDMNTADPESLTLRQIKLMSVDSHQSLSLRLRQYHYHSSHRLESVKLDAVAMTEKLRRLVLAVYLGSTQTTHSDGRHALQARRPLPQGLLQKHQEAED